MKKYVNVKCLVYLCCILAVLICSVGSASAQRRRAAVKNANWQISVPPNMSRSNAQLGIRDKYGDTRSFKAAFVVTGPGKKVFRARAAGTGDEWAYINFPDDFDGTPTKRGTFTVVFYANGVVVGRSTFKFRP